MFPLASEKRRRFSNVGYILVAHIQMIRATVNSLDAALLWWAAAVMWNWRDIAN